MILEAVEKPKYNRIGINIELSTNINVLIIMINFSIKDTVVGILRIILI